MKKVRVCGDASGNIIVPSKTNPEYGHIRVEQERMIIEEATGFARSKTISALIPGLVKDLKNFGWVKDQEVEGKVIFKEQLAPFNMKDAERDYKIAGKTEITCCVDGQPIYRKTFYSPSEKAEDVAVAHTNGDDIKAAYALLKEQEKINATETSLSDTK
jgi:hypothetical protein